MDVSIEENRLAGIWPEDQPGLWSIFRELVAYAQDRTASRTSIVERPGVSFSFRAEPSRPVKGRARPVFFLMDAVVSEQDPWFLSVCFYDDEISDPRELGNPIPRGLYDETGFCFDVDDYNADLLKYLEDRISEAYLSATGDKAPADAK
jgi:hypothetical protein